ncbi:MAG: diguanylate cyclase [Proteobacteria bacterium]|nr:diguanylate cyclase [Pseudomonadota bacterium]
MKTFTHQIDTFVEGLDAAIDAHMDWTRRILRCAVLRVLPGDDVLLPNAHTLCRFGMWLEQERAFFDALDADLTHRIEHAHQSMHESIRAICACVLEERPGQENDLNAFDTSQAHLLSLLAHTKTLVLTTAARHDPLTGLPMRFGLEQEFELCRKDVRRRGERLHAVMIDIDHFKHINDTYGHPIGDIVLQQFATALKSTVRENEPLYRFGGEEFFLLIRCAPPECVDAALERIIDAIRQNTTRTDCGLSLHVTATLGVALVSDEEDLASAVKRADEALYAGKNAGRNRFVFAPNTMAYAKTADRLLNFLRAAPGSATVSDNDDQRWETRDARGR